jgi:hypothetical protein
VFEGEVSLAQGGGFASVRSSPGDLGRPGATACRIEVRGDGGKVFEIALITSDAFDGVSYKASFARHGLGWQVLNRASGHDVRRSLARFAISPKTWHRSPRPGTPRRYVASVTQAQYTGSMKSAVIPQIRVEPELRSELESVLRQGETLTEFVEASVRNAIAFRRVQIAFHERAQAASEAYHRTGVSVPVEDVLERLQAKLDARRQKLGR